MARVTKLGPPARVADVTMLDQLLAVWVLLMAMALLTAIALGLNRMLGQWLFGGSAI